MSDSRKNDRCCTVGPTAFSADGAGAAGKEREVSLNRRGFLRRAGASGLAAAAAPFAEVTRAAPPSPDGTPEQIHLTWAEDPSSAVVVSWASAAQAINPRVLYGHG